MNEQERKCFKCKQIKPVKQYCRVQALQYNLPLSFPYCKECAKEGKLILFTDIITCDNVISEVWHEKGCRLAPVNNAALS